MANERGEVIKKLTEQYLERKGNAVGLFTLKKLIEDKDSYFGYSPWDRNNCTKLWWLDRKQWSVSSRELCLSDLSLGSLLVHNIKQAHYVEHYTMRSSKSYILIGDEKIEVEGGIGRGAASSPDGCKIAYGVGDKKKHQAPVRQNLKVFNYCEYVSKEGEILWKDLNL